MKKIKKSKAIKIIISVVLLCVFTELVIKPIWLPYSTYWCHMYLISSDFTSFNTAKDRLPRSLEETVEEGYAPKKSKKYYCPMKHNTLFSRSIPYTKCEFEFIFEPNQITIKIPEISCKDYPWLNRGNKELTTNKGVKTVFSPERYHSPFKAEKENFEPNDSNFPIAK